MNPFGHAPDEQLVRAALTGKAPAVAMLYDRYAQAMFRYCLYQLGDEALAKDLMQDVFVEMIHSLRSFSFQGSFKNWLYTIAKRQVLAALRQKYQLPKSSLGDWIPSLTGDPAWIDPKKQDDKKQQTVNLLLKSLKPQERTLIELTYLRGFSSREAASVTGRTPESVRVTVHRALKKLAAAAPNTGTKGIKRKK